MARTRRFLNKITSERSPPFSIRRQLPRERRTRWGTTRTTTTSVPGCRRRRRRRRRPRFTPRALLLTNSSTWGTDFATIFTAMPGNRTHSYLLYPIAFACSLRPQLGNSFDDICNFPRFNSRFSMWANARIINASNVSAWDFGNAPLENQKLAV